MKPLRGEIPYLPLVSTLKRLESWLEHDGTSRFVVAEPTIKKLKAQGLPDHIKVIPKRRRGKRKALRTRRNYNEIRAKLAVWPDDHLDENALPFVTCCTSGEADLVIADYVLRCRAGDWVFFPAGIPKQDGSKPHLEGKSEGRKGDVLWINAGATRYGGLSCWICRSDDKEHYKPRETDCRIESPFLAQLFNGFCEEVQGAKRTEVMVKLLSFILFLICKEIDAGNVSQGARNLRRDGEAGVDDPITQSMFYIDENLHQHLTIDKVARQVAVSPATFTRHFKERTGSTFYEYQTKRRMETAEILLKTTSLTVLQVCQRVGLQYGQLRKLFLKKHGCSPSKYRGQEN